MTADDRKIIIDYLGIDYNTKIKEWNLIMPAVRKIGEDLLPYWKEQIVEAWSLQNSIEFYIVNVQFIKAVKAIIDAIQWVQKEKNIGNA